MDAIRFSPEAQAAMAEKLAAHGKEQAMHHRTSGKILLTAAVLAALLARLDRRPHPAGQVGCLYLIFYSVGRFLVEFLRNDYRGEVGFLSTSQFISVGVLLAGLLTLRTLSGRKASHE